MNVVEVLATQLKAVSNQVNELLKDNRGGLKTASDTVAKAVKTAVKYIKDLFG